MRHLSAKEKGHLRDFFQPPWFETSKAEGVRKVRDSSPNTPTLTFLREIMSLVPPKTLVRSIP